MLAYLFTEITQYHQTISLYLLVSEDTMSHHNWLWCLGKSMEMMWSNIN